MVGDGQIEKLKVLNTQTLGRLRKLLQRIDEKSYTQVNKKGNASIGQHVRHALEFYDCLLNANSVINYDLRKRDLSIETSVEHAIEALDRILSELGVFGRFDRDILLQTSIAELGEQTFEIRSSVARELFYVLEHAIHHKALIRVLIKDQLPGFGLDKEFGVAYSTLAHLNQEANG